MKYELMQAKMSDLYEAYSIIVERVKWMNENGIHQWNVTGYLERYSIKYFKECIENGTLYIMKRNGKTEAIAVLLEKDLRWGESKEDTAYYIHNFASRLKNKGLGKIMIGEIEKLAARKNKKYVRLDCPVNNSKLNEYYRKAGYEMRGQCDEIVYKGNLREKKIYK